MPEDATSKRLSPAAWSAVTAITVAVISAVVTLTTHFFKPSPPPPDSSASPAQAINADILAGKWGGTAAGDDKQSFDVEVVIARGCAPGAKCGTISVSSLPCDGMLYLQTIDRSDYEFRVDNFTHASSKKCTPGAGEHLQPQADGTLLYWTTYEPHARGTLRHQ